ncbi:MAG: hypothetical protein LIO79_09950, partial [Rikenellaceae bacterium]|nr:hypothetical protein [Rikenellaceae bacterium]
YTYLRYENIATRQNGESDSSSGGENSDPGGSDGGNNNDNNTDPNPGTDPNPNPGITDPVPGTTTVKTDGYQDNKWGESYNGNATKIISGVTADSTFPYQNVDGNYCVPLSVANTMSLYGSNLGWNEVLGIFNHVYGNLDISGGLDIRGMTDIIPSFFYTTNFTSYENAINSGYSVFTTYGIGKDAHSVTVVGYNSTYYTYLDPECSNPRQAPKSHFNSTEYNIVVTGSKY